MYSERIRKSEAYYGTLLYQRKKGREEGLAEGIEKGMEKEIEKGKLETFVSLVNKGLLSAELAAKELALSISEFEKHL